jgi:hypothetical protein
MYSTPRIADAVSRLKGVFLEVPQVELSTADASRLSGLERPACSLVLRALEDAHFIKRAHNGLFVRHDAVPKD